jgi:hypothetical protein
MLDDLTEHVIGRELGQSEELLWAGRPRQGFSLGAADAMVIPFSLIWGGCAIFWEIAVIANGAPLFFPLLGVPFVLIGLYFMLGRFWVDSWQRAATTYGVTSERVVIVSGLMSRSVKSLNIDTISEVTLTERSGGSGDITFGSVPPFYWWYAAGWPFSDWRTVPSFELADNAREVYEIVRKAQCLSKHRGEPGAAADRPRDERFRAP